MNGCKSHVAGYSSHLNQSRRVELTLRLRQIKNLGETEPKEEGDLTDLRFSPGGQTAAWGTRILPTKA
jgi:hypothetical protein